MNLDVAMIETLRCQAQAATGSTRRGERPLGSREGRHHVDEGPSFQSSGDELQPLSRHGFPVGAQLQSCFAPLCPVR